MLQSCMAKKKTLLNICDKKLSCSLQCRIKQSFFSGLAELLTGLVLGALAVTLVVITTDGYCHPYNLSCNGSYRSVDGKGLLAMVQMLCLEVLRGSRWSCCGCVLPPPADVLRVITYCVVSGHQAC